MSFVVGIYLFLCILFALCVIFSPFNSSGFKHKFGTATEQRTLAALLDSMRTNPDEWVVLNVNLQTLTGLRVFNDKKGILIMAGDSQYEISIQIGSKINFNTAVKTDGIVTYMRGPFITKFLKKAENILNIREKELNFFKGELDKKLQG